MELKPFKMKPHALNAAKKHGWPAECVQRGDDGMWYARPPAPAEPPVATPQAADTGPVATGAGFPDRKAPVPANPVAFIRETLRNVKFGSRKEAIAFFVAAGINVHTAKTQYQRWRSGDL